MQKSIDRGIAMNPGEYALRNPLVSWLLVLVLCVGGAWGFLGMGKLEDPAYTLKMAKIITLYPGASAEEVRTEVSYHIEDAIQRMEQVRRLRMTVSRPGVSDILIEFKDTYRAEEFPAIFDELRRKIADVRPRLPPGAEDPMVIDDFGDIYGVYLALSGEGYTWRDLWETADTVKRELLGVRGVRKVNIEGEQREVVYMDISRAKLGELGISPQQIAAVLQSQNAVVDAGRVRVGDELLRIAPSGEPASVAALGDILLGSESTRLVRLSDIAQITRAYEDVPQRMFYVDGHPALTIGVSMSHGENVVETGRRVSERLAELAPLIPTGMVLQPIYDQPAAVADAVRGFQVNVAQSVAIVLAVLLLFMGIRVGLVIGAVLLITISGTLFLMHVFGIELHRMSLGALIIALGMLVDNAIVVAEGMLVRLQAGEGALAAARESVGRTLWALFGGTAIGAVAFSPIAFSPDTTGEFAGSLFWVVLISLLLSWVTAIMTTPVLAALAFRDVTQLQPQPTEAAYHTRGFLLFRSLLAATMRHRWFTLGVTLLLFAAALWGFSLVKTGFFPASNTAMMFVDVWEPEGSDIRRTHDDALRLSEFLATLPGVQHTALAVGGPHQRFTLVYDIKEMSDAYAQIIVQPDSRERIAELAHAVKTFMGEQMPWTDPVVKQLRIGPTRDSRIELRFSGHDAGELRRLAEQAKAIMRADGGAIDIRDDWREPVKVLRPIFDEQLGRRLGISREDLAKGLQYAAEGTTIGLYRDGIHLLPIRVRAPLDERGDITELRDMALWSPLAQRAVPVTQVVSRFETRWENALLRSRDRQLTLTVSCNPAGEDIAALFHRLEAAVNTLELPPGYGYAWGGEFEDSSEASEGLRRSLPFGLLAMVLISVLLFGRLRQPLIIWLTVPLALIGVTVAMLASGAVFDFMSIVGALALAGLLIKNAIVLIEEIDLQIGAGHERFDAVLDATVSRLRPVALAAATTIFGMVPLLGDAFFRNMAITMMGGLGFATLLTLFVVPALYLLVFRIPAPHANR